MLVKFQPQRDFDQNHFNAPKEGAYYIVYALEFAYLQDMECTIYISVGSMDSTKPRDPFPFEMRHFKIVDPNLFNEWQIKTFNEFGKYTISFREWLEGDFAKHAHDYDMTSEELAIFDNYRKKYEETYGHYLAKN